MAQDKRTVFEHAVYYEDGSGPRTAVAFDTEDHFTDGTQYFEVKGVGGSVSIHVSDLWLLKAAIERVEELI